MQAHTGWDHVAASSALVARALPSAILAAAVSFVLGLAFFALQDPEVLLWACRSALRSVRRRISTRHSDSSTHDASPCDGREELCVDHADRSLLIERPRRRHVAAEPPGYSPSPRTAARANLLLQLSSLPEGPQACACGRNDCVVKTNDTVLVAAREGGDKVGKRHLLLQLSSVPEEPQACACGRNDCVVKTDDTMLVEKRLVLSDSKRKLRNVKLQSVREWRRDWDTVMTEGASWDASMRVSERRPHT